MATVSIDLDAMARLLESLETARDAVGDEAQLLRGTLEQVQLDSGMVSTGYVSELTSWLEESVQDVHRRLAVARMLAASEPGLATVEFDESTISGVDPTDVDTAAEQAALLMAEAIADTSPYDPETVGIDPQLLVLLEGHALDPYFAASLVRRVGPQEIDFYLGRLASDRVGLGLERLGDFDADYERVVTGLGISMGMATANTGSLATPDLAQDVVDYSRHARPGDGGASRIAVVIARGQFDSQFLLDVADGVLAMERDSGLGAQFWANDGRTALDVDAVAPAGVRAVQDPMYGVLHAMAANPEAMRQWLSRDGRVELAFGDHRRTVDTALEQLMMRHVDGDTMEALFGALQAAHATAPADHPLHERRVGDQLEHFGEYFQWHVDNAPPWWKELIHSGLDLAGLFPGVGEWADGLNAALYAGDGRWRDSAISAGAAAVGIGSGLVIARLAGRSRVAQQLASMQKLAERLRANPPTTIRAGDVIVPGVPPGARGAPTDNRRGLIYEIPPGTPELDPRVTQVRIMEPGMHGEHFYPRGYAVYMNKGDQAVDPFTGRTLRPTDPLWHIGLGR